MAQGPCAQCGGPNPPESRVCQWCGGSLALPSIAPSAQSGYRPLDIPSAPDRPGLTPLPTTSPWLYYRAGIPLVIVGVVVLGISAVIAQGVASYNSGCSAIPNCMPQSDPSGGIAAFGIVLLLIGIVLIVYGASQGQRESNPELQGDGFD